MPFFIYKNSVICKEKIILYTKNVKLFITNIIICLLIVIINIGGLI